MVGRRGTGSVMWQRLLQQPCGRRRDARPPGRRRLPRTAQLLRRQLPHRPPQQLLGRPRLLLVPLEACPCSLCAMVAPPWRCPATAPPASSPTPSQPSVPLLRGRATRLLSRSCRSTAGVQPTPPEEPSPAPTLQKSLAPTASYSAPLATSSLFSGQRRRVWSCSARVPRRVQRRSPAARTAASMLGTPIVPPGEPLRAAM